MINTGIVEIINNYVDQGYSREEAIKLARDECKQRTKTAITNIIKYHNDYDYNKSLKPNKI